MFFQLLGIALLSFAFHVVPGAEGHGYLATPRSRNFYAHDVISNGECPGQVGCPPGEYCQHCLNTNTGACGKSTVHDYETYTGWLDKTGQPMPWRSQGVLDANGDVLPYQEGGLMVVDSYLDTHHNGHHELRACVMSDADPTYCSDPSHFEGKELHFVRDLVYPGESHPAMPPDPAHPERGMYAGGQGGGTKWFRHEFQLPMGVAGDRVLLQWKYITANSCSPPGYSKYFSDHPELPSSYWTQGVSECTPPYPSDGTRSTTWPEQFFNCAEISVATSGPPTTATPTVSSRPTAAPTTANPTVSESPTRVGGPPACVGQFMTCTSEIPCCEGFKCMAVDITGYSRCLEDTCIAPPPTYPPPTYPPPPAPPTNPPPSPTPPTGPTAGCCTINLKTCHHEVGNFCRQSKENCEGPCGKLWLPDGPLDGCIALWEQGCSTDGDCCQHGECREGSCESNDPWLRNGTPSPTKNPTPIPTDPTKAPTPAPTTQPTTAKPTDTPTPPVPTKSPTKTPTKNPTNAFPNIYSDKVRVNQVGYLRFATKVGTIVDDSTAPIEWQVQDAAKSVVLTGMTTVYGADDASGDHVHQADFSSLSELGAYKLVLDGVGASLEFNIAPSLYPNLPHEAMNYFYFHRMGNMAIEGQYLIDDRYARASLHPADTAVPAYPGWCSTCSDFDLLGSWADAGDFGIYTVNHAISAWTLLNLHEMFPEAFTDGSLNLPESGNSFPDVLDEVDYGSRFVRGMLPSDGGLASHKAHNHAWSPFSITIEGENAQNAAGTRSAMGSSTPATYAVARVNAQLARMWHSKGGDGTYVALLFNAAKDAWNRADGTSKTYNAAEASPGPAVGGGDYPDGNTSDDRYAAACEMYLTAYALEDAGVGTYKAAAMTSTHFTAMGQWDWATVTGAGTLSLYAVDNDLDSSDKMWIESNIISFADQIKVAIDVEGYPSNLNYPSEYGQYPWGSNSFIMNRMIVLAYAYEITSNDSYQKYLLRSMDYIMGTNAMDISYVTGYGEKAETDTHDRWAWTIGQDAFWPRGWLSGGPNNELINDYETPGGVAAAKSYAGPGTAPHAWGSKENTVNWNAPLAWVAWYIEEKVVPNLGGCGGNCPPLANSLSVKVQMDSSISLVLSASDYDGAVDSWEIVNGPVFGSLTGNAPDLTYTPNNGAVGTDTFTFRVFDNAGEVSNIASATLIVQDCDLIDIFQVPSAYATFSGSYNYVHVSEDGPSLESKIPAHNVQWQNPGLHQFSLELEVSPYYLDLQSCMTDQALSGLTASFTLSGCGISGLDGDYWITNQNGNEIWVEKTNGWALVFTNDASYSPEFCRTSGPSPAPPTPPATPNPSAPPTRNPTPSPTDNLTPNPTPVPTAPPTNGPTDQPTKAPVTPSPTGSGPATPDPTSSPTRKPTPTPTPNPTDEPTPNPTLGPTPNPTPNTCTFCDDRETNWQTQNGFDCATDTVRIGKKCNKDSTWTSNKYCQLSCYNAGNGYPEDVCCPATPPTPNPTPGATVCCAERNQGYQTCKADAWCNASDSNCGSCGGIITAVPLQQTGCCSWGGNDCSGIDPMTNAGCHFLQSDCEGSCFGNWQPF